MTHKYHTRFFCKHMQTLQLAHFTGCVIFSWKPAETDISGLIILNGIFREFHRFSYEATSKEVIWLIPSIHSA
jgi:hypothetical protein